MRPGVVLQFRARFQGNSVRSICAAQVLRNPFAASDRRAGAASRQKKMLDARRAGDANVARAAGADLYAGKS